jgi:hypothetical protein
VSLLVGPVVLVVVPVAQGAAMASAAAMTAMAAAPIKVKHLNIEFALLPIKPKQNLRVPPHSFIVAASKSPLSADLFIFALQAKDMARVLRAN